MVMAIAIAIAMFHVHGTTSFFYVQIRAKSQLKLHCACNVWSFICGPVAGGRRQVADVEQTAAPSFLKVRHITAVKHVGNVSIL